MIRLYLRERLSWILFHITLLSLLVFIAYIDPAISIQSILYYAFLAFLLFAVFLLVRYNKETKFYSELSQHGNTLDVTTIRPGERPFERIVEEAVTEQAQAFKKAASQNMLALEQEKDDLLSWIHEVKTPLTAMHLIIGRLEDEQLKRPLIYEWLRIHLLLDQQLHQKRISFIENDLYIEKTNIEALLHDEIKNLQSWCIQKGIGFNIDLKITEVLSDAKWLSFILRQLLSNSVKYSSQSEIVIESFMVDGRVSLKIQDYGRGITAEDLPRIFDKGFTSTADHQNSASTGMGLYLAKKAAKPLLIDIQVKSEPGAGSTFSLTFPKANEFLNIMGM